MLTLFYVDLTYSHTTLSSILFMLISICIQTQMHLGFSICIFFSKNHQNYGYQQKPPNVNSCIWQLFLLITNASKIQMGMVSDWRFTFMHLKITISLFEFGYHVDLYLGRPYMHPAVTKKLYGSSLNSFEFWMHMGISI